MVHNTIDNMENMLLKYAAYSKLDVVVEKIIKRNKRPLLYPGAFKDAILYNSVEIVKLIYEHKSAGLPSEFVIKQYIMAVAYSYIDIIKYLYSKGVPFPDIVERNLLLKSAIETTKGSETVKFLLSIPEYEYLSSHDANYISSCIGHSETNHSNVIYYLEYLFSMGIQFDEDILIKSGLQRVDYSPHLIEYLTKKFQLNQTKYYVMAAGLTSHQGLKYLVDKYSVQGVNLYSLLKSADLHGDVIDYIYTLIEKESK
jgi:hypothetical protein